MRYAAMWRMPREMPEAEALEAARQRFMWSYPTATDVEAVFTTPMLLLEGEPDTNMVRVEGVVAD